MTTLSAEVAEAVRLRDAATPGPWDFQGDVESGLYSILANEGDYVVIEEDHSLDSLISKQLEPDMALAAAAPQLVDLIERLHARGRVLEAELEQEARVSNLIINGLRLKTSELENELEQARAECEAIKLRSGELCEKCGWRSKFVGNQCLCCMANAENFP